jgi:molecular chaperone HtpG
MTNRGRFQLHLPGLLKVLAEHLYSNQRVGIRELIQNAHDSCLRRSIEQSEPDYRPRIDLSVEPKNRLLRVADNGSGLTEDEIRTYLTVIGRGYTSELRERLATDDLAKSRELIGQFGIGFLSAYLLASEVTVETRSKAGPALRWFSTGNEQYELTDGNRAEIGTTVDLRLKPSAYFLLREQLLVEAVREYADFLPIAIHVQGSSDRVNLGAPPWDEKDAEAACCDYVKRRFDEAEPLWVLPLTDGIVDLGHDTITVPLRGFLFVPAQSIASIKEYGTVAVYIRQMAICDADTDLLPVWARFIRGVIDCPALQPTASREAVHQDDSFEAVRQVVTDQLADGLHKLASKQPEVWRKIAYGHSDVIMGWASKHDEFFRMVVDTVPLQTSRGRIALPEYLRASGNVIYYTTRKLESLQEKVLAEGSDVPAIDASWFGVSSFLTRYTMVHPAIKLVRLDDDLDALLRPVPSGDFEELVHLCEELGFAVRVSSFRPNDLPAVMTYPAGAESAREAQSALDHGLFPEGFSSLVENYLHEQRNAIHDEGTLHLNAACPLIRRLVSPELSACRKQAALSTIAYFAKLFCGRMLEAYQATSDLGVFRRSLERLIES